MYAPRVAERGDGGTTMRSRGGIPRRAFLTGGVAAIGAPGLLRYGWAQDGPIRIGIPTAVTGAWAAIGAQVVRTCKLAAKEVDERGGLLKRKVEFLFEDTQGDPARCVGKSLELVERQQVSLLTGIVTSAEALAVSARLAGWNAFLVSSISGAAELTGDKLVPNLFRTNISAPMSARTVALYVAEAPARAFFAIGPDHAAGRAAVAAFEPAVQRAGKQLRGTVFAPAGTKDYSTQVGRIRQSNADGLYVALSGDDAVTFYRQAATLKLGDKVQMITDLVDVLNLRPTGDAALGLVGASRYSFTYDTPENRTFVQKFQAETKEPPDTWDGEQYQALQILFRAIEKAKGTDTAALIKEMEGLEVTAVKGKVVMRECDHQGVQVGLVVRAARRRGFAHAVPEVIKAYPADAVTPPCRTSS